MALKRLIVHTDRLQYRPKKFQGASPDIISIRRKNLWRGGDAIKAKLYS